MPCLETHTPVASPKSLASRVKRQNTILAVTKATHVGKMVMNLRREVNFLHDMVMQANPENVAAIVGAACKAREQLADFLALPKRPTAPQVKPGRLPPPVDITPDSIQDAAEVAPRSQAASPE